MTCESAKPRYMCLFAQAVVFDFDALRPREDLFEPFELPLSQTNPGQHSLVVLQGPPSSGQVSTLRPRALAELPRNSVRIGADISESDSASVPGINGRTPRGLEASGIRGKNPVKLAWTMSGRINPWGRRSKSIISRNRSLSIDSNVVSPAASVSMSMIVMYCAEISRTAISERKNFGLLVRECVIRCSRKDFISSRDILDENGLACKTVLAC